MQVYTNQKLNGITQQHRIEGFVKTTTFNTVLEDADIVLAPKLIKLVRDDGPQKIQLKIIVEFKHDDDDTRKMHLFTLKYEICPVASPANVRQALYDCFMDLLKKIGVNNGRGTKGMYKLTHDVTMINNRFQISSGGTYIPVPKDIGMYPCCTVSSY